MTVVSLDARHYQMLDRRSVLAVRMAAATSFGSERMLYFLGGVDNGLFSTFNNTIPIPQEGNFAFEALATNLRGFPINIRNGNSYALINSELRVPIFKYFSRKPVMGNFWRNFQIVGFFDVGTAWQGGTPYGGDNPINTVTLTEGPAGQSPIVIVKVNYFRDPLVAGYGIGARALIFGMYLRADYGWGIETRVVQKPRLHLALGTDF
jgi:outer membrane protein assembly factor BamA